jgi:hypothetical protein
VQPADDRPARITEEPCGVHEVPVWAVLQAEHSGWKIWSSDAGHWYASRRSHLAMRVRRLGLYLTVDATDLEGLADELAIQEDRAERALAIFGSLT